jgi:hypothetical protein
MITMEAPLKRRRGRPDTYEGRSSIALGLAVAGATLKPGETRTCTELAAYAGCTRSHISAIERKALRKIRNNIPPDLLRDLNIQL